MEAKQKNDTIEYLKKSAETAFTHEETAEIIVPDSLPDIADVVQTQGMVTVRSKEAGSGRISVSGLVSADVIYRAEDGTELHRLETSIPFTAETDAPQVTSECLLRARVNVGCVDSRIINSRKALVRADVVIEAEAYQPDVLSWSGEIEDDFGAGIETLGDTRQVSLVTGLKEKTFVLNDEFTLPAGKPAIGQVLKTGVGVDTEDVKCVGSKLIFKGDIKLDILYMSADESENEPQLAVFSAPFSQILEMDSDMENGDFDVQLMTTNCYIDSGDTISEENAVVAMEIHLVAQAISLEKFDIPYISDVYSTMYTLKSQRGELSALSQEQPFRVLAEARETVELAEPVHKVLDFGFTVGKTFCSEDDGSLSLKVTVYANAMYLTEGGRISGVSRRMEVKSAAELSDGFSYSGVAGVLNDAQALPMGNSIEFHIPVRFQITPSKVIRDSVVVGVSWDEDEEMDLSTLPSLVIHHAARGENLWSLAKKYCSTEELIASANELDEGVEPEIGSMLIIPRKK